MHHARRRPTADLPEGRVGPRARLLLLLLCVAQLMVILDISAVNVALPDLAGDIGLGRADLTWTITSYSVAFGGLLLLGGRAADLLGRRRVFLGGLVVFTVASLASALAGSAAALFAARAAQGAGAALLSPAALSILVTTFREGRERTAALGAWGAVGGAGAAVGVLLGGALTELVDWRAIFFINLPIGLALAAGALHVVPADATRPAGTASICAGRCSRPRASPRSSSPPRRPARRAGRRRRRSASARRGWCPWPRSRRSSSARPGRCSRCGAWPIARSAAAPC